MSEGKLVTALTASTASVILVIVPFIGTNVHAVSWTPAKLMQVST